MIGDAGPWGGEKKMLKEVGPFDLIFFQSHF